MFRRPWLSGLAAFVVLSLLTSGALGALLVWTDRTDPLLVPRGSEALFVLQHIRDEAHRTAVAYHRSLREKRALHSPLDDIPGVGPARKQALLKRFGSLVKLRAASVDELAATKGVGPGIASTIYEHLHEPGAPRHEVSA